MPPVALLTHVRGDRGGTGAAPADRTAPRSRAAGRRAGRWRHRVHAVPVRPAEQLSVAVLAQRQESVTTSAGVEPVRVRQPAVQEADDPGPGVVGPGRQDRPADPGAIQVMVGSSEPRG